MRDFFEDGRVHEGLSYDEYLDDWTSGLDETPSETSDTQERKMRHYVRYNHERSEQVHAQYEPSAALQRQLASVEAPQLWMVLTETWCGDSAYCLPVIAEAVETAEHVTLRILPRDENLDIMDQYLTGESRSIPKLVAFGEDGEERFTWGPRPQAAQAAFDAAAEGGADKEAVVQAVLAHYDSGGWQDVDTELAEAMAAGRSSVSDGGGA